MGEEQRTLTPRLAHHVDDMDVEILDPRQELREAVQIAAASSWSNPSSQ